MSDIIEHDVFGNCQKPTGASMGYKREPAFRDEPMHTWWIKGPHGGVHIWARLSKLDGWPTEWIGGVECHWAECPDNGTGWHKPDAPSHSDCWLLGGQCWHDGTSLYFQRTHRATASTPGWPRPASCRWTPAFDHQDYPGRMVSGSHLPRKAPPMTLLETLRAQTTPKADPRATRAMKED